MSHTTTVKTKITNKEYISGAVNLMKELGLEAQLLNTNSVKLFQGNYSVKNGIAVRLPNWKYPILIDLDTGEIYYDNYNGIWGSDLELQTFKIAYQASSVLKGLENMLKKGVISRAQYKRLKEEIKKQIKELREAKINTYKLKKQAQTEEKIRLTISL